MRRDHPLRRIRAIVNEALATWSETWRRCIRRGGGLRSRRKAAASDAAAGVLVDPIGAAFDGERLEYDLLFRWFVGIGLADAGWDHSVFSNRHRLLEGDIAAKFLGAVLAQPR